MISDPNSNEVRVLTNNTKFQKRCPEVGKPGPANSQPVFVGSINKYISNYEEPFSGQIGKSSYRSWKGASKDSNSHGDDGPFNPQAFTARGQTDQTLISTSKICEIKKKSNHSLNIALPGSTGKKLKGLAHVGSLDNILHSHQSRKKESQSNTDRSLKPNQTTSFNFSKLKNATLRNRLTLGNPLIKQDTVDRPKAKINTVVGLDFVMGKSVELPDETRPEKIMYAISSGIGVVKSESFKNKMRQGLKK